MNKPVGGIRRSSKIGTRANKNARTLQTISTHPVKPRTIVRKLSARQAESVKGTITSRQKKQHNLLLEKIKNYQAMFDEMNEGVALNEIIYDSKGDMVDFRILQVNKVFPSVISIGTVDPVGMTGRELYGMTTDQIRTFWRLHRDTQDRTFTEFWNRERTRCYLISVSPLTENRFVTSFLDITSYKQDEILLRSSEEKFHIFIDQAMDGFTLINEEGSIIEWNHACEVITGWKYSQVVGEKIWDIQQKLVPEEKRTPESLARRKKLFEDALREGESPILGRVFEAELARPDGQLCQFRQAVFPIKTSLGYQIGMVSQDITEMKIAEAGLRASERKYRQIVETAREGIWVVDADDRTVFVNGVMAEMLGYRLEEIANSSILSFMDEQAARKMVENFSNGRQGRLAQLEMNFRRKNGSYLWTIIETRPILNEDGSHGGALMMITDITRRKKTEAALQKSRDRYERAANTLPVMLYDYVFDTPNSGHFLYVGPQPCRELLELEPDAVLADMDLFWNMVHPDDIARLHQEDTQANKQGKSFSSEVRITLPSSRMKWILITSRPNPSLDGERAVWSGFMQDITERKDAEETLKSKIFEIQSLHEIVREQAIRDPLTGLYNRRFFNEMIERELARAERENVPISLIMMDLDHFKNINDMYGHEAGDLVLMDMSSLLRNMVRIGDLACRYGGDEFVIVMPGADLNEAGKRAEEIRQAFNSMVVHFNNKVVQTTTSIGISSFPLHGRKSERIVRAADLALYQAKQSGRNCVHVWIGSQASQLKIEPRE